MKVSSEASPASGPGVQASLRKDYWELTKPRLTFLVLVTTFVGFCMAGHSLNYLLLLHTMLGTAFVAGGAAVLNQFLEKEQDARMKRTENRPLAADRISLSNALVFGVILSIVGLLELALNVNVLTAFLGGFTLSIYIFVYTPLKKKTPFCTLIGAIPGAIPPMMGWTAVHDSIETGAWILFSILFLWQMPHFFALAQLYRDDYARGGFPMLTVLDLDGSRTGFQIISHTLLLLPASLAPTLFGMTGKVYFYGALVLNFIFIVSGFWAAFVPNPSNSRKLFFASIFYLPILLILMVANKIS